jgi:uncharacterized DUF497 family protein
MLEPMFDWDDANIAHIARHRVTVAEAEAALLNDPYDLDVQIHDDEERAFQIGTTRTGRILALVSIIRNDRIRVLTAFPAKPWHKSLYLRAKGHRIDDQT